MANSTGGGPNYIAGVRTEVRYEVYDNFVLNHGLCDSRYYFLLGDSAT